MHAMPDTDTRLGTASGASEGSSLMPLAHCWNMRPKGCHASIACLQRRCVSASVTSLALQAPGQPRAQAKTGVPGCGSVCSRQLHGDTECTPCPTPMPAHNTNTPACRCHLVLTAVCTADDGYVITTHDLVHPAHHSSTAASKHTACATGYTRTAWGCLLERLPAVGPPCCFRNAWRPHRSDTTLSTITTPRLTKVSPRLYSSSGTPPR